MKYRFELIVDGKRLAEFHTKDNNGKDAKFVSNALLNDSNCWMSMYPLHRGIDVWTKETVDGRTCYLELIR